MIWFAHRDGNDSTQDPSNDWMRPADAARYVGVSRNTIYRWCKEGRLRYYTLDSGGGRRFRKEDLNSLFRLQSRERA